MRLLHPSSYLLDGLTTDRRVEQASLERQWALCCYDFMLFLLEKPFLLLHIRT